jgi:hypothetical protein
MKNTLALSAAAIALLLTPITHAATTEFKFQGTLSTAILGSTSVSGKFGFDFTTDAVTSYKFTAPGDGFDSTVFEDDIVNPFTSSATPISRLASFLLLAPH